MENEKGISRRNFIKGVGGVAAATTILGFSGLNAKAMEEPIPAFATLPKEKLLDAYRKMVRIRQGEVTLRGGHSSDGEEACALGVVMAMKPGDVLGTTHRSHAHPLAMGVDMKAWVAELKGKVTGTNKGRGGTMHIADPKVGMLGAIAIVAAGVPHAVGAATAFQISGAKRVAISVCGDGATNKGPFHECLNMAAIWDLPVVFVVNNNQWAVATPSRWDNAPVRAGKDLSVKAAAHAIPGITVDGNDFFAVYNAAKYCIERAREGKGPSLLDLVTYRQMAHAGPQTHEVTRWPFNRPEELEYWLQRDPIKRFERNMLDGKLVTEGEVNQIRIDVAAELKEAIEFADKSPFPDPEEVFKDIYA